MPMKLNVGVSKKQGLPDYGSVGASCAVEMEVDASLLEHDLTGFQRKVQDAFTACRQAVNDELARHEAPADSNNSQPTDQPESRPQPASRSNGNHANGNGSNGHRASQKQQNYIGQLAGQISGLGSRRLESLAQKMFGKPLADLTSLNASSLIDMLKAVQGGQIKLEDALNGAPA